MITTPATLVSKNNLLESMLPNHVAEAPKRIKTAEKPRTKRKDLAIKAALIRLARLATVISSRETPETKEM
jgi:hypothetical protein